MLTLNEKLIKERAQAREIKTGLEDEKVKLKKKSRK